jgi:hypothetical protein
MPNKLGWGTDALGRDRTFCAEAMGVGVRLNAETSGVEGEVLAVVQPAKASVSALIFILKAEFVTTGATIQVLLA